MRPIFRVVRREKSGNLRGMSEDRSPTRFNAKLTRVSADLITLRVRFNDVYTALGVNTITVPLTEKDLLKICLEGFNDLAVNRPTWAERINQEMIEALGGKYDEDDDGASSDLVEHITDETETDDTDIEADKTESQADHGTTAKKPGSTNTNTNTSASHTGDNPRTRKARKAPKK